MVFYRRRLSRIHSRPRRLLVRTVAPTDLPHLLAIGIHAQIGQYCFLRAYQSTPANILAPIGYLSIVLATLAGFLAFDEIPAPTTLIGTAIIICALTLTTRLDRPGR